MLRELKVILVGRGEVGKTSLIEVLKGGTFIEGTKKTEGIAITGWSLMLPDGEATALVWDFGGQEIMHGTHQFFLTHRSLYLVVVDGQHGRAKQDAEYWLKLVRAFGGQSPVLVVLNAQRRHSFDTDREYLATKYGVAREHFFRTDCADGESISLLRRAIEHEAEEMLTPKELFPAEWWSMKQRLGAAKEEERLGAIKTIIYDQRTTMRDHIQQNFSGGTFHGPVAAVMKDCTSIINSQPPGERKDLLEMLHRQVGELISGPPAEKQQFKKMVADRLKELTEGVTSGTPDRAWYSVSSKGLLEAAKFVKDFTAEISGTLKNLGISFWKDFTLTDISPK